MRFDDRSADGQADAHALLLGRHERLEQLLGDGRADAGARVCDADLDQLVGNRLGRDREFAPLRAGHGFEGVADQVQQNLLDLYPVRQHVGGCGIERESYAHAPFLGADERQRARLLDELR